MFGLEYLLKTRKLAKRGRCENKNVAFKAVVMFCISIGRNTGFKKETILR